MSRSRIFFASTVAWLILMQASQNMVGDFGEPTKGVSCGDREREDHGQQSLGTVREI